VRRAGPEPGDQPEGLLPGPGDLDHERLGPDLTHHGERVIRGFGARHERAAVLEEHGQKRAASRVVRDENDAEKILFDRRRFGLG
jgi:hypothetical protein